MFLQSAVGGWLLMIEKLNVLAVSNTPALSTEKYLTVWPPPPETLNGEL